jgi:hypothetical protein
MERYHVRLGKRRTTVSVDKIISDTIYWAYKAIRLAATSRAKYGRPELREFA